MKPTRGKRFGTCFSPNTTTLLMLHAPQHWLMKMPAQHQVQKGRPSNFRESCKNGNGIFVSRVARPVPLRRTSLVFELHQAALHDAYDHYDGPMFTMDEDDDEDEENGPTWI